MDNEMFNKAINAYVADDNKNLSNLSKYAKEMRVYKKVTELMEVMLNGGLFIYSLTEFDSRVKRCI